MGDGVKFTNEETRTIIHALQEYKGIFGTYVETDNATENKIIEDILNLEKRFSNYLKRTQTKEDKEMMERINKRLKESSIWPYEDVL